jgi:hypothetical protein
MKKLRDLQPDAFEERETFPVFKWDLYRMSPFAAGDVRLAMKAGG